ncbi:MAG: phosphatidylglycerol lysyltransferase domain-containing protein [Candidatus Binatia bacterium]
MYRDFFVRDKRVACYGNSWVYIKQACRGLGSGLKYHDRDVLLSVGRHRGHYVVVRPLGNIDRGFINLLRTLRETSGKPVFIKKLFSDQVARLRALGAFSEAASYSAAENKAYAGLYPWDAVHFADDDTYPEVILDLGVTLKYRMKPQQWLNELELALAHRLKKPQLKTIKTGYRRFRRNIKQFLRLGIECRLKEYDAGCADEIRRFLLTYFGSTREENVAAYEAMLASPQDGANRNDRFCFVAHVAGVESPVGFFFVERLDEESAGLYAGVVSRTYPGLPEYLRVHMMSHLREAGIRFLNLGGSETESLHAFKRKQGPVEERPMATLVYGVD